MSKYLPSDRLLSYQPLFIKDVTTADIQTDQPLTLKTKHNLLFQKVKINGLILSRQDHHGTKMDDATRFILLLDDASAVIPVHFSQRLHTRQDSVNLIMAASVTILGEPQQYNNSIIIVCKGFQVESDPHAELYHYLKVISNHNDRIKTSTSGPASCYYSNGIKRQKRSESSLFNTLSSQPSPIRGSIDDLYPSPTRNDHGPVTDSQNSTEAPWHWSPDHIAATSTPIKTCIMLSSPKYRRSSPLRLSQKIISSPLQQQQQQQQSPAATTNKNNHAVDKDNDDNDDDDDDDFGFADSQFDAMDFDDLEKKALEARVV